MTKMKRFIAVVLSLVMLLSFAPTGVLAVENDEVNSSVINMTYDDRLAVSTLGQSGAPVITDQVVTSKQTGTDVSDEAVVEYDAATGKLIAVGVGTAVVTWGEGESAVSYDVTVSAAPISLFLLIGQSNMEGAAGTQNTSIANEDGQVYSSYGPNKYLKVSTAGNYVPASLTEVITPTDTSSSGGAGSAATNALTASGAGKGGMDSGIAYAWTKLTGEKVWLVNAAHGGTSINTWQPGVTSGLETTTASGNNYAQAVALFQAAQATMKNEIMAGHYTLSHMGYFWCQGCNDNGTMSASEYITKYTAMHNGLKTELAYDFGNGTRTLEFGNIVMVRAVATGDHKNYAHHTDYYDLAMSGPRTAQYYMGNSNSGVYADINVICNLGDQWVTMPDGTDGAAAYFAAKYPNGIDYPIQSGTLSVPTKAADVHPDIHYRQVGYNELGLEAARNTYYLLNESQQPEGVPPEITLYKRNGYSEWAQGETTVEGISTVVVPVVSPVYLGSNMTVTESSGAEYENYTLTSGSVTFAMPGAETKTIAAAEGAPKYEWTFTEGLDTENKDNLLTVVQGSAEAKDGKLAASGAILEMANGIDLPYDENWVVEWKYNGDVENHILLSSALDISNNGSWYILGHTNNYYLGTRYNGKYANFRLGEMLSGEHTYTLKNINGVISFAIDGVTTCNNVKTTSVHEGTKEVTNTTTIATYRKQLNNVDLGFKYFGCGPSDSFTLKNNLDSLYIEKGIVDEFSYEWTFDTDLDTENKDNKLTAILNSASVQNGQLVADGVLKLANPVNLSVDENWTIEWQLDGAIANHAILIDQESIVADGAWYIFRNSNMYFLGTRYNKKNVNFLLSADGYTEGEHTFTLKCVNGVISFAVDGVTTCENVKTTSVHEGVTEVTNATKINDYRAQLDGAAFAFWYMGSTYKETFYANSNMDYLRIEKPYTEKLEYEWTFDADLDTENKDNKLTAFLNTASVKDGQLVTNGALALTNGVNLSADEDWTIEWEIDGTIDNHIMLSSEQKINTTGSWYILRNSNKYLLGTRYDNTYANFLLSDDGYTEGPHTFTLKCVNGVISFEVDGVTTCEDIRTATVCVGVNPVEDEAKITDYRAQLNDAVFLFKYVGSTHSSIFYANDTLDSLYIGKNVQKRNYAAEANGVKYETLEEAIAAGGEVKLLADCEIAETIEITGNITLDLNGKTISGAFDDEYGTIYVKVGKSLTVTDSGENGKITSSGTYAIGNYGTVTIKGGILESTAADCAALYNFYYNADNYGTTTIEGGEISKLWNSGILNVSGGEVAYLDNSGALTVTGGTVTEILAKDGTDAAEVPNAGTLTIEDISAVSVLDGYKLVENTDGTYKVVAVDYVAEADGVGYETLEEAIAAGGEVKLLADYEITKSIKVTNTVTVDLNGFKVTGPDDGKANWYAFIVDGGDLTLKDSVGTGELYAKCYGVETKSGSFTMESGKITATKNKTIGTAIVNYGGTVTINGGTVEGVYSAVYTSGYFSDASTTILDGTITGVVGIKDEVDANSGDYTETVNSASNTYTAAEGYEWVEENGVYVLTAEIDEEEPAPELFDIAGANLELANDITMYFYVNAADFADGYYMEIVKSGKEDAPVIVSEWGEYMGMYRVGFNGIAAKEMTDDISVTVYNADGVAVSNTTVATVSQYALNVLNSSEPVYVASHTLMADLLNYGAAAQTFFGYNTDKLANAEMTDAHRACATQDFNIGDYTTDTVIGTGAVGANLGLETNIIQYFYFDPAVVNNTMTAKISYTNCKGVAKTAEISGDKFGVMAGYGYIIVDVAVLVPADVMSPVTVEIVNAEGVVVASVSESIASAAVRANTNSPDALYEELMKYCLSCEAYFG